MKAAWLSIPFASYRLLILTAALIVLIALTTSCGSNQNTPVPRLTGNTSVSVLLSSTANDQVTTFDVQLQTLTLTSQSGKTVTLLSSQQPSEFMHLNGAIEPLTTVTVPQDVYTSATVTLGAAVFVCIGQVPAGGLGISNYSLLNQGATVTLPTSITVTGSSMALLMNMQVSSSAVFSTCWTNPPFQGFSMAPTFNLAPFVLSASPANSADGKVNGLKAQIASVGSSSTLSLTVPGGLYGTRSLSAAYNGATVFHGVSGASALAPGMFLDMDAGVQRDGSLLATRIAVEDSSAVNQFNGPVMTVANLVPSLVLYGRTELGTLLTAPGGQSGIYVNTPDFDFSNAVFSISGQMTNLQNLPFVPSFNASSMVAGQNVDITSPNLSVTGGAHTPAHNITLVPQVINGTVIASQQVGAFTDYTVSLAPYDLFPTLAIQQGQTTVLSNPAQVEVYVDSNTHKLNAQPLAPGGTLRFYGLVFNDNGTLRMDCAEVNDGVAASPGSAAAAKPALQQTTRVESVRVRGMKPIVIGRTVVR